MEIKKEILDKQTQNFRIITSSFGRDNTYFFLIEAEDEEMVFLKLRFGENFVWKR